MSTLTIEVNGRKVEAKKGETILSALKREGVKVPTLCYLENLAPSGACRMCVVEVEGSANLVPSCSFPVAEGMKIRSNSPSVMPVVAKNTSSEETRSSMVRIFSKS